MKKITLINLALLSWSSIFAQTNPTAQALPYSQAFGLAWASTTYPAGWQGWQLTSGWPSSTYLTAAPSANAALIASADAASTGANVNNYNGKIGFCNGASSSTIDAELALAITTTGNYNITVQYDIMVIRCLYNGGTQTQINEATLQYRVGTSGVFTTLAGIDYNSGTTLQSSGTTPVNLQPKSILLPSACDNQAVVQLRWTTKQVSGTGQNPGFAVDNISVTAAGPIVPVADFTASATSIFVGNCINFTDLSTNTPTSWSWVFNGGTPGTSTTQNPTNICYATAGNYDVTLTATNAAGSDPETKIGYITVTAVPAAIKFQITYPGLDITSSEGPKVIQSSDGNFVMMGTTNLVAGVPDMCLVKVNTNGSVLWAKAYGGIGNDYGKQFRQTADGGYIITGTWNNGANAGATPPTQEMFLLKVDASGVKQWAKTFGTASIEYGYDVMETSTGMFVVVGFTNNVNGGLFVVQTNSIGVKQWDRSFGRASVSGNAHGVVEAANGEYVVAGVVNGTNPNNVAVYRISTAGAIIWRYSYNTGGSEAAFSIGRVPNGEFILSGYASNGAKALIMNIASNGATVNWGNSYDAGANNTLNYSLFVTSDNGAVINAHTNRWDGGAGNYDYFLIKTDATGAVSWAKTYGLAGSDQRGDGVYQCADGSYILNGTGGGMLLIKTDVNGVSGCNETVRTPVVTALAWTIYSTDAEAGTTQASNFSTETDVLASTIETNLSITPAVLCTSIMPIELLSFSASCHTERSEVSIHWQTATEINNDYFEIERKDGSMEDWKVVGTVQGAGNSSTILKYEFIDNSPSLGEGAGGRAYYRLRQVDHDGKYEYFGPISVNLSNCDANTITVLPAVSHNGYFTIAGKGIADVTVYTLLGEKVLSAKDADLPFVIDITANYSGVYVVKIKAGEIIENKKIIYTE